MQQLQELLSTRYFGRAMRAYAAVDSTNTLAMEWAEAGAAEGSVVTATYQRAGRGRQGKHWWAAPGKNLLFSVILRPRLEPSQLGLIALAASLAVVDALKRVVAPTDIAIKWPNDILLSGRKCCGILLESAFPAGGTPIVVLGLGLNVNQEVFPPELAEQATSLLLESGTPVAHAPLLARLIKGLEGRYEALYNDHNTLHSDYTHYLHGIGQIARIQGPPTRTGIILGVTDTGALQLQTPAGLHFAHNGSLEFL